MAKSVTCIPARETIANEESGVATPKRKVAAYCRVSTDEDQQLSSLQNQLIHYRDYILSNNQYELVDVYADEGISGTNTKKREQFNRMIQDCKDGKINLIITKSISRFARNTLDCLQYVRELKEIGVEIFFEKENILTLDSKGELLLTILSSLAQEESNNLSQITTWGVRRRFEQGKVTVNEKKFLGYDKDEEKNLIINKSQAKIVERIYAEFLNGKGPTRIARELERDKIKGVTGSIKWYASTINKILSNEKYKGDALLQKTYTVDFLTKKRIKNNQGKVTQYYVEESHPPIIQPEVWEAVQLELERRKRYVEAHKLQKYDYGLEETAFAGRVICGKCGAAYKRKGWHSNTKPVKVWQCGERYKQKGVVGCESTHVYEAEVNEAFVGAFNALIDNKEVFISKWGDEMLGVDALRKYRLKQMMEIVSTRQQLEEVDIELAFQVLEKIAVVRKGLLIVRFLDGTEIECES